MKRNLYKIVKLSGSIQSKNRWSMKKKNEKISPITFVRAKSTPKLIATFYCSRKSGFYLFSAFFLIFLITALSLTVFSIPKSLPANRLPTTYTILLSSISFKWVVNIKPNLFIYVSF